jgi:hypothetical protein
MLAACAPVPRPVVFPGYPATTVAASGDRDRGVKRAVCCLAGPVAESACSGVSLDRLLADTSAADDVEMARAALALDARAPPFGPADQVERWPIRRNPKLEQQSFTASSRDTAHGPNFSAAAGRPKGRGISSSMRSIRSSEPRITAWT